MKLTIDEGTKEILKEELKRKNKSAARVMLRGFGCSGPAFGVVLDKEEEKDEVIIIDGIKIVADKEFAPLLDQGKIVHDKGPFGIFFTVEGGPEVSC
ncbi:MAG: adhesin [Clostridiales bacterium]|nr:adhesin [Clostridiales bacterium]